MKEKKSNYMSNDPCIATGTRGDGLVCFHHLLTRKVHPEFSNYEWNKIPVSQSIHNEFHARGTVFMAEKYPSVKKWLISKDWFFCTYRKKWLNRTMLSDMIAKEEKTN